MSEIQPKPTRTVIGGRHGSPTVTVALPFSKITTTDSALRDAVGQLAELVARLAGDPGVDDRATVAKAAQDLAQQVLMM